MVMYDPSVDPYKQGIDPTGGSLPGSDGVIPGNWMPTPNNPLGWVPGVIRAVVPGGSYVNGGAASGGSAAGGAAGSGGSAASGWIGDNLDKLAQQGQSGGAGGLANQYPIDPNAFGVPGADDLKSRWDQYGTNVQNRTTPQVNAPVLGQAAIASPTTIGPAAQTKVPKLGPTERVAVPKLPAAAQAAMPTFGPAASAAGLAGRSSAGYAAPVTLDPYQVAKQATLNPAAQAADSSARANQVEALDYQGALMRGEKSVAAIQMARNREAARAAQRSLSYQARPGQQGMAMRLAGQNMARIETDMASREAEARLAERNAAAALYGQFAQGLRGQDLSLNQFNAGESNKTDIARAGLQQSAYNLDASNALQRNISQGQITAGLNTANAGFQTQSSIANAANQTNLAGVQMQGQNALNIAKGETGAQVGMFNTGQKNNMAISGADLALKANTFNAGEANQTSRVAADLAARVGMANTAETNATSRAQANIASNEGMFNAGQTNTWNMDAAKLKTSTDIANAGLTMQGYGQQDAAMANVLNGQTNIAGMQQAGSIAQQKLNEDRFAAILNSDTTLAAIKAQQPADWERYLAMGMGIMGFAVGGPTGAAVGYQVGNKLTDMGPLAGGSNGGIASSGDMGYDTSYGDQWTGGNP
jgi:hypothetical protein